MIDETLAHFRITAKLGEGGMGTVWRAQDAKLGRDVALKFVPDAFAADAERMARFTREAQVLASLNHPNIAGIYSVEEARRGDAPEPLRFLVMELVEGEDLHQRLARGPLPLDEALRIGLQIATGLEEAHERGIVHRDLKPANVKVTPARQVKILDFGLAKAFDPDATGDSMPSGAAAQRLSLSPTMTGLATQAGMLMGTAAYMSPEQARGEPVDRRADIWAFGVVLMEMLTGKVVHGGRTISDTLASVLARDPAWDELPADTPRAVRRLLERCLEKDSRARLRDVGEARIALERFIEAPESEEVQALPGSTAVEATPRWKRALPWSLTGLLALALVATAVALRPRPAPPQRPLRLNLALPEAQTLFTGYGASAVLSPDGSRLAYVLSSSGNHHDLFIQALDQWVGTPLVQAEGMARPYQPFFSPDGQWIGFVTPGELRKVPVSGGTSIKLCDADRPRGASWGPDGTIVFALSPAGPLMRVPEAGGEPEALTQLDAERGEATHRWPQWLPGGRALVFTSHTKQTDFDAATVELLVVATGERRVLHRGGSYGRYVGSAEGPGYLVYSNGGALFAIPFDLERLQATGSAAPVVQGVTAGSVEGSAQFGSSADGKLVYASGAAGPTGYQIAWLDAEGRPEPLWDELHDYAHPAISPDGTRFAVRYATEGQGDLWVYDIARGVPTRLTFEDGNEDSPVWSPDGQFIYYRAENDNGDGVYRKPADGSGEVEEVLVADEPISPGSISPDGNLLAFTRAAGRGDFNVGVLRLDEPAEPEMLVTSQFIEAMPSFSPDGRWLAYTSLESGLPEVYVRPVVGRGKWQISKGGGTWPAWSPDGSAIFYSLEKMLSVTEVDTSGATFRPGRTRVIAETVLADAGLPKQFDVAPDGRILITYSPNTESPDTHQHLQLVLNWHDELRATFGK